MTDYVVKDLSLADWGRKEIEMAQDEMPGLMSLRREYGAAQPLKSGGLYRVEIRDGRTSGRAEFLARGSE